MAPSVLDDAEELADMPAAAPLAADPAVSEEVASLRAEVEALRAARPAPAADLLEEIASLQAEIETLRAENAFARSEPSDEPEALTDCIPLGEEPHSQLDFRVSDQETTLRPALTQLCD